jgi:hypothetical protein
MYLVVVHFKQTFDSMIRNKFWGQLIGIPTKLIQLMAGAEACVKTIV